MKESKRERNIKDLHSIYQEHRKFIKQIKKQLDDVFASITCPSTEMPNKSIYTGEWLGDSRSGIGRNLWPTGDVYEGYWENDMQEGFGRNLWTDGSSFIGQYSRNIKDGVGEYKLSLIHI